MAKTINPENRLLASLAEFVRPIEVEIGRECSIRDAYIGVAFRWDTKYAVFFAEYLNNNAKADKPVNEWAIYLNDEYLLPNGLPFVVSVLDDRKDSLIYRLVKDGNSEVEGDIRKRWGEDIKKVHILRLPLTPDQIQPDAVLYLVKRRPFSNQIAERLRSSVPSFISQGLRTAFFLAVSSRHGVEQIELRDATQKLTNQLRHFREYEVHFRNALNDFANPSAWFTHGFSSFDMDDFPILDQEEILTADEKKILKAIRNARRITVKGNPEGSFQKRTMMHVEIEGRDREGLSHGGSYEAIVKEVAVDRAQKEQAGYQLAQFFFNDIRFALPPAAILWPIRDADNLCKRFTAVIPRITGQTLSAYISEKWHSFQDRRESKGDHFGHIVTELVRFLQGLSHRIVENEGIREELPHECLYDSHFGSKYDDAKRRLPKTERALRFYLERHVDAEILRFHLNGEIADVVNPLWVLLRATSALPVDEQTLWKDTAPVNAVEVDFAHGDFHCGNILVSEDGGITVLDYDYVGRDREFTDIATLEASLLLSLSQASIFRDQSTWLTVFPPLLTGLAKQNGLGSVSSQIRDNQEAFNAWRVIQKARVHVAEERAFRKYRPLLVSALLRLITSNHGLLENKRNYHPGLFSTAIFYLGRLLKDIVVLPANPSTSDFDLFLQPSDLGDGAVDFRSEYCREYFGWLAQKAEAAACANTDSNVRIQKELGENLRELINLAASNPDPDSRATMLRFGHRLAAKAVLPGELIDRLTLGLTETYASESNLSMRDVADRKVLARWTDRYRSNSKATAPKRKVSAPGIIQGIRANSGELKLGNWSVYGATHSGNLKAGRRDHNDDAFLMLTEDEDRLLFAVADGTGDSIDGTRASNVALKWLAEAWRSNESLDAAVTIAAIALQDDNRKNSLDGACTLVALSMTPGSAQVVHIGDTRYFLVTIDNKEFRSEVDIKNRAVLGGEPLGDIITSSGNVVQEITKCRREEVLDVPALKVFALASDGIFFQEMPKEDFQEIKEILDTSETAEFAAEALIQRSLNAFRLGPPPKSDNITIIVGYRS